MLTKPGKLQKPIKKSPRENGETRCILKSRSGCNNSKKILWKVSVEPTFKRREDLCKHSVCFKDRNCEICKRTKITRAPCRRRNGGAVLRAENFGDLITRSSVTIANLQTISWNLAKLVVKSTPPTAENWLRKLYQYSKKNYMSTEDKHETTTSTTRTMTPRARCTTPEHALRARSLRHTLMLGHMHLLCVSP